jgi:hypothetical protein
MSGPRGKDISQRRRNSATPGFEQLDPDGQVVPAPEWPFGAPTLEERAKWDELWRRPQSLKWQQIQCEDTVALYVRALLAASEDMNPKIMNEVRQLDNKLGLSPQSMRHLGWEVPASKADEPSVVSNGKTTHVYVPT